MKNLSNCSVLNIYQGRIFADKRDHFVATVASRQVCLGTRYVLGMCKIINKRNVSALLGCCYKAENCTPAYMDVAGPVFSISGIFVICEERKILGLDISTACLSAGIPPNQSLLTWIPKVCKIMAFMAIIGGLGLLFCILLGFRYTLGKPRGLPRCLDPTAGPQSAPSRNSSPFEGSPKRPDHRSGPRP